MLKLVPQFAFCNTTVTTLNSLAFKNMSVNP